MKNKTTQIKVALPADINENLEWFCGAYEGVRHVRPSKEQAIIIVLSHFLTEPAFAALVQGEI